MISISSELEYAAINAYIRQKLISQNTNIMKDGIHPDYNEITVVLSDGTEIKTRSTMNPENDVFKTEVDSKNHPFYTDNLQFKKKAGRIDRFNKRYGKDN